MFHFQGKGRTVSSLLKTTKLEEITQFLAELKFLLKLSLCYFQRRQSKRFENWIWWMSTKEEHGAVQRHKSSSFLQAVPGKPWHKGQLPSDKVCSPCAWAGGFSSDPACLCAQHTLQFIQFLTAHCAPTSFSELE